jgi:BarA-like signal transduction histidine kinase
MKMETVYSADKFGNFILALPCHSPVDTIHLKQRFEKESIKHLSILASF